MRRIQLLLSALLLVLLVTTCAPKTAPALQTPAAAVPAPVAPAAMPAPGKPAWEVQWERVVAGAKKEGRVVIFSTGGSDIRTALAKIAKLQGLRAEVITGRPAEFLPKVFAERRAGLYLIDAYMGGYFTTLVAEGRPDGILQPLDSALILPDLTDPERIKKVWYQGKFPWVDTNHTLIIFGLQPGTPLVINTSLVKPGELKSYRDLLDHKWKEKLIVYDPTVAGAGIMGIQGMMELMGEDFIRELAATKPIVLRDQRQMLEWLAQGKVAIVVSSVTLSVVEFIRIGAPIKVEIPKEGVWVSPGASALVSLKNAPHPNAIKVFINLIASKEGQEIYMPAGGWHSLRLDVSTAHLQPEAMRQEGVKYIDLSTEEAQFTSRPRAEKLAKDLFGPLIGK